MFYKLDQDNNIVKCEDFDEFMVWRNTQPRTHEHQTSLHIGHTEIGDVYVSTIFKGLGLSMPFTEPLLFETMIFGGPNDTHRFEYATYDEAITGHKSAVALVEKGQE